MSVHGKRLAGLLLFLTLSTGIGVTPAAGDSIMPENKVPGQVESKARRLMQDLKKQGYEVSRGYFKLYTMEDCDYTFARMRSCFGNNPAAPYVTLSVPPWPEEFVDPVTSTLWGPSHPGYIDVYRLDPREAIIILGKLPPPGAFFSEQTWLFTRQGTFDTGSSTYQNIDSYLHPLLHLFFATVPGNPARVQAFASLSNPNNNVVIERQSDAAFDQIRYFIITPDRHMENAVRGAFAGMRVDDSHIFTEPIPSDMRTGLHQEADDFTTAIRYAQPDDGGGPGTASSLWRKNLPLVVLRVRETRTNREPQPYPPVVLEERSAADERPLKPDLDKLLAAVSRKWGQPCVESDCSDRARGFLNVQEWPTYMVGPLCIPIGENCLGDTWDTTYQFFGPGALDSGEIYAVAGSLGTATGNATYVGLGVNQASRLNGVANLSDEELKDTAKGYAGEVNNTGKFYLYYFTRDCSGLEELTEGHCFSLPESMIPKGDRVSVSLRDYLRPGTQRGPDSSLMLPSRALKLERP